MKSEIETRFLEIDKDTLVTQLTDMGAHDEGETLLGEVIFYDQKGTWMNQKRLVRLRSKYGKTIMTYKHHQSETINGAKEVEFEVPNIQIATEFLEATGLKAYRHQEKLRHTFHLDDVTVDIDTWPNIPSYVEFEGSSEEHIKSLVEKLGLDWNDAIYEDAGQVLNNYYGINIWSLAWFTFDRVE